MRVVHILRSTLLAGVLAFSGAALALPQQASAASSPTVRSVDASFEHEVLRLTNVQRKKRGLRALAIHPCTELTSTRWARSLASRDAFHHQSMRTIARACSNPYVAENIAWGRPLTPAQVVGMWMRSPGHRTNILNRKYRYLGTGAAQSARTGRIYVVQNFRR